MNQRKFWEFRWKLKERKPANNLAKRCFPSIKNKGYKTLLDLGCADGKDSIYFAKKGLKVTAMDFSQSAINRLKNILKQKNITNVNPICQDIRKLDFPNNSFDIIYAHLSLHYFNDKITTKIFNKLHRILKNNGSIFIKCKSTDDALYGKGTKIEDNMYKLNNHIRHFFTKNYMKNKLKKFKIIKIRKTSSVHHKYKSSFIEAIASR